MHSQPMKKPTQRKQSARRSVSSNKNISTQSHKARHITPFSQKNLTLLKTNQKHKAQFSTNTSTNTSNQYDELNQSFSLITEIQASQQQLLAQIIQSQLQQQQQIQNLTALFQSQSSQSSQSLPQSLPAPSNFQANAYMSSNSTNSPHHIEQGSNPPTGYSLQTLKYAPLYTTPPDQRLNESLTRVTLQVADLQTELSNLIRTLHPQKAGPGWSPPAKKAWSPKPFPGDNVKSAAQDMTVGASSVEAASDKAAVSNTPPPSSNHPATSDEVTPPPLKAKPKQKASDSPTYLVKPDPKDVPKLLFNIPQADI